MRLLFAGGLELVVVGALGLALGVVATPRAGRAQFELDALHPLTFSSAYGRFWGGKR